MADKEQQPDEQQAKEAREEAHKQARAEIDGLEEGETVPSDARDWPTGKAQYLTFGHQTDEPYGEGPTAKLGPAGVQHHEGGAVSVDGKLVENPEDYKGEPIPGGPTDPNAPKLSGEKDSSDSSEAGHDSEDADDSESTREVAKV